MYAGQMLADKIASPGSTQGVDWEDRVNFERLRQYRMQRIQEQLDKSDLGALLLYDMDNIRYSTAGHIGAILPRVAGIRWRERQQTSRR